MNDLTLLGECVVACEQDTTTAVLLYTVRHFEPMGRVWRKGYRWCANDAAWWQGKTGLTPEQYQRALKVMKNKGWIETAQMFFAGSCITHIRIAVDPVTGVHVQPVDGTRDAATDGTLSDGVADGTHNNETSNNKYHTIKTPKGEGNQKEGEKKKAGKNNNKQTKPCKSAQDVYNLWAAALIADNSASLIPEWTVPEKAIAKHLLSVPDIGTLLPAVIDRWFYFITYLTEENVCKKPPTAPTLKFLVKFRPYIVPFFEQANMPAAPSKMKTVAEILAGCKK